MSKPTREDAKLLLKLYDIRRDELLRKARNWIVRNLSVSNLEELMENYPPASDEYAYIEIVTSYWETAGAMIYYGILNEDLFFETTNEHLTTWKKIEPWIEEFRQTEGKPHFLENFQLLVERHRRWNEKRVSKLQAKEEFIEKGTASAEEDTDSNAAARNGKAIGQIKAYANGEGKSEAFTSSASGFSEETAEAEFEEVLKGSEEEALKIVEELKNEEEVVIEDIAGESRAEAEILTKEISAGEKPANQLTSSQE
ncbi:MAG: hypothetical protein M1536_00330 [Firmicutes bacterium]|nr:hypothetical protein [Bacillota bacterium]